MVVIRLSRGGAKKSPYYHLVVTDSRNSRDGRYIEQIGFYNPLARGKASLIEINKERVSHWLEKGALMSDRVSYLMSQYEKLKANPALIAERLAKRKAAEKAKKEAVEAAKAKEAEEAAKAKEAEAAAAAKASEKSEAEQKKESSEESSST